MRKFSHAGEPEFFDAVLDPLDIGSFSSWTGTVSDRYGETASGGDNRGNCTT
jgi:hypothetical protein